MEKCVKSIDELRLLIMKNFECYKDMGLHGAIAIFSKDRFKLNTLAALIDGTEVKEPMFNISKKLTSVMRLQEEYGKYIIKNISARSPENADMYFFDSYNPQVLFMEGCLDIIIILDESERAKVEILSRYHAPNVYIIKDDFNTKSEINKIFKKIN